MITIIAGSRNITNYTTVYEAIKESGWMHDIEKVVSGRAKGVDSLGEQWAREHIGENNIMMFPADWKTYGKSAGYVRNQEMALAADSLIAVWNMKSKGTMHMIDIAQALDLQVFIWRVQC